MLTCIASPGKLICSQAKLGMPGFPFCSFLNLSGMLCFSFKPLYLRVEGKCTVCFSVFVAQVSAALQVSKAGLKSVYLSLRFVLQVFKVGLF